MASYAAQGRLVVAYADRRNTVGIMNIKREIIASFFAVLTPASGFACWMRVPLDRMVDQKPLIVVGKIEHVEMGEPLQREVKYVRDIGVLKVSRVLKNTDSDRIVRVGDTLRMRMGSPRNKTPISADIHYAEGVEGVWLLDVDTNGYVDGTSHPEQVQPIESEAEIIALIDAGP
ncbi:MAG: hypothetical protein ACON4T_02135 [Synechococcus sp.]